MLVANVDYSLEAVGKLYRVWLIARTGLMSLCGTLKKSRDLP